MTTDPTQEHHKGLPNDQVRDLIATEFRNPNVAAACFDPEGALRAMLVNNLNAARERLADHDRGVALKTILVKFGWKEHDVSESVNYRRDTYRPFIGTDEEKEARYPSADPNVDRTSDPKSERLYETYRSE